MCLALPARVVNIDGVSATVDVDGVRAPVSLAFLDGVSVGDYVVVHVGYALTRIDPDLAAAQIVAMKQGLKSDGPAPHEPAPEGVLS